MTHTVIKSASKKTFMLLEIRWKKFWKKNSLFKTRCTTKKRSFHNGRLTVNIRFILLMLKLNNISKKLSTWKKNLKMLKMTYRSLKELGIALRLNSWSLKRSTKTLKHSSNRLKTSYYLQLTLRRRTRFLLSKKFSWWEKSKDLSRTTEKRKELMAFDYIDL
jgi:hypothetical protein